MIAARSLRTELASRDAHPTQIVREVRLATTPSHACTFVQESCSASVPEAIFRRLRSRSPHANRLSTICARRRPDRAPFDARPNRTRPAIRGMFACLSTLTRACRTAIASVHIFRRPRTRSPRDARLSAHTAMPAFATPEMDADFRSQPMASGPLFVFRSKAHGPARQLALPTGARSHLSMLAPADTRAPFSAPIFRSTFPPALMSSASVLILRPAVHRKTSVREPLCVSRRSRSIGTSVLTLALVFARVASSHLIRTQSCDLVTAATAPQFFHARPHTCLFRPCGLNEHTHCARSYSAYCHRESLARSSRSEPPCSSFRAFRPDLRVYGIASVFA